MGLLKEELRRCGSLIMSCADAHRVGGGGALAVDRRAFSQAVTQAIRSHPAVTVVEGEVERIPEEGQVIVAAGPLASDALTEEISRLFPDSRYLNFFDAAAPLVTFESVNMERAWFASRYDRGHRITSTVPWRRRSTRPSGRPPHHRPGGGRSTALRTPASLRGACLWR